MAYQNRRRRRMAAEQLEARATSSRITSLATLKQPTAVLPLTTRFTPPSSCFENKLTMLPSPVYAIWANEPVPVENFTVAACYPPEFLSSYTSISSGIGSSIVPAMSPFVCPQNFCTVHAEADNYIACCPSGYKLHPPDTILVADRPMYGGVCFSDFVGGSSYTVLAYNETGDTATQMFSAKEGDQAFAHPIDGFALTSPTIGCAMTPSSSSSSSASGSSSLSSSSSAQESSTSSSPSATTTIIESNSVSKGAIAGASVGGVVGLAAIVAFVWFILGYYRRNRRPPTPPPKHHHIGDDFATPKNAETIYYRHEAEGDYTGNEIATSATREKGGFGYVNNGRGAHELDAMTPVELDASPFGKSDSGAKPGHAKKLSNPFR